MLQQDVCSYLHNKNCFWLKSEFYRGVKGPTRDATLIPILGIVDNLTTETSTLSILMAEMLKYLIHVTVEKLSNSFLTVYYDTLNKGASENFKKYVFSVF